MIHGIATIEAYHGAPTASAELVAQWISLTAGWAGICLRPSSGRPLVYLESHLDGEGYRGILSGAFDDRLSAIRDSLGWAPDSIVRWDHEMSSPPTAWRTWGQLDPELYVEVWQHVAGFLGPMCWSPTANRIDPAYWPGAEHVSFAGFTYFDHGRRRSLVAALSEPIEAIRTFTDKPILITELGSANLPDKGGRVKWLESSERVNVWGACYFDIDRSAEEGVDWTMNKPMRKVWA